MNITIEELEKLEPGTFDVIDMRGETEIAHGAIPGSVAIPEQELLENPPENTGKKLIIVCSRGRVSVDVSEELCGRGYEAYSLEGGYIGWLMSEMKKQEAEEICESVDMMRILEHGEKVRMVPTDACTWSVDTPEDLARVTRLMEGDALMREYAK